MVKQATPPEVNKLRGSVRMIDVREPHEFNDALGHVEGAELVPLATVATAAARWDKSAPLVMICRSSGRSGRAADLLASMGFKDVTNMVGGMLAWNENRLPVARGESSAFAG